jgi:hypothetical protein
MSEKLTAAERSLVVALAAVDLDTLADHPELPDVLREMVNQYCAVARSHGLPPERVVLQLKEIIANHYGGMQTRTGLFAREVVWNAVQRCIKAYFSQHDEESRA